MMKTYIFGHKNPDCDSAVAAKAYEWFLNSRGEEVEAILQDKPNNETKMVFEKFGQRLPRVMRAIPSGSNVIIVDTTEPGQLPDNLADLELLEIWDHHKLGGLKTSSPLKVLIDGVGCSCTLLTEHFLSEGREIDPKIAGLMLSAIISDTLNFASPTSTERDKKAVTALAKIVGIDNLKKQVEEQFAAKSSLDGMSPEEIIDLDAKDFLLGDKRVKVAVLETVDPSQALAMSEELRNALRQEKSRKKYNYTFLFVVDILKGYSVPIIVDEAERQLLSTVLDQTITDDTKLEGVVSRKKQIIPPLEAALQ